MTWQTINRILNRNNKKKEGLPDTFREKNSNVNYSDPIEIANKFNEYFVNVGPNLAKGIQQNDTIPFENYLKGNYRESMFTEPVTEYEILTEIDNLNVTKSADHDNISAKMVKAIKQEICKPLAHIFNLTFETGFIYLFIVLRFQTSYNNCIKEAGTPQQLNTNYSGPFTKYQYKYRKQK